MEQAVKRERDTHWLERLARVADEARDRVSDYADDRRSRLERFSRSVIQGAKAEQVCRH